MSNFNVKKTSKAFCPGHITGIVERKYSNDFLHMGSIGAGFSIEKGVKTTVTMYDHKDFKYSIIINRRQFSNAEVSNWIVEAYHKLVNRPVELVIEHNIEIPIGYGLGTSGAAALSLSYALNEVLETCMKPEEVAQIAHTAEIICNTGLGSVIAEYIGGFEIRTEAGAPGIGKIERIEINEYKVIIQCFSPLSTRDFIDTKRRYGSAQDMINELNVSKSIELFLEMSYKFCMDNKLITERCMTPIQTLRQKGILSSMALFGETLFTIVPIFHIKKVINILKEYGNNIIICNIDNAGARVLN